MKSTEIKNKLKPTLKRKVKAPRAGDVVKVHQIIKEKGKDRVQIFEGLVIATKKTNSIESTFTVRKIVSGMGVERTYPLYSPHISEIKKVSSIHSRQAKIYYVRDSKKRLRAMKKEEKKVKVDDKETKKSATRKTSEKLEKASPEKKVTKKTENKAK